MSLIDNYKNALDQYAQKSDKWHVLEGEDCIVRVDPDALPLAIKIFGDESVLHLCFNLYRSEQYVGLARKLLKSKNQKKINLTDDSTVMKMLIDEDGFGVFLSSEDVVAEVLSNDLDSWISKSEVLLEQLVRSAVAELENEPESTDSDSDSEASAVVQRDVKAVIETCFDESGWKYRHDEDNSRFITGLVTTKYADGSGNHNLMIVVDYASSDLLRVRTPFLYQYDLDKVDYSLIASIVVWCQFKYKFLAMSLDPVDGELTISLDIPLGEGVVHHSQIMRLMTFIYSFVEETDEELLGLSLRDPKAAKTNLQRLQQEYKDKANNAKWVESVKDKLKSVNSEQREAIDKILSELGDELEGEAD